MITFLHAPVGTGRRWVFSEWADKEMSENDLDNTVVIYPHLRVKRQQLPESNEAWKGSISRNRSVHIFTSDLWVSSLVQMNTDIFLMVRDTAGHD